MGGYFMRKLFVLLLCIFLSVSLTSCGLQKAMDRVEEIQNDDAKEKNTQENDITETDNIESKPLDEEQNKEEPSKEEASDFSEFTSAISNFTTAYFDEKAPHSAILEASTEYQTHIFSVLNYLMVDLALISAPMYDALDLTGSGDTKITGQLMLSGYQGTKEKDGDLIRFGYEHTFKEESGVYLVGDTITQTGYFNMSDHFLTIEDTLMSEGSLVQRSVTELLRLSDGTFILQNHSFDTRNMAEVVNSVFNRVNQDELISYTCTSEPKLDFTFKSLSDAKDISMDDLSKGFTTTFVLKVENSKATFEEK